LQCSATAYWRPLSDVGDPSARTHKSDQTQADRPLYREKQTLSVRTAMSLRANCESGSLAVADRLSLRSDREAASLAVSFFAKVLCIFLVFVLGLAGVAFRQAHLNQLFVGRLSTTNGNPVAELTKKLNETAIATSRIIYAAPLV
jgi:hypothetical protein